ncbi:virosome component [Raccoonpox virus]|uniref:Protein OPG067 n=1 Tax=Raccoon poxvirus TaxID=10256 RepID=A0A0G3FZZ5_RACVI|nr:Virosome component [Raccoonpox virus]AKJ93689.1 Virosome component [Raccoonpox virus]AOP31321.1 virosome component [Raccoonpox virus]
MSGSFVGQFEEMDDGIGYPKLYSSSLKRKYNINSEESNMKSDKKKLKFQNRARLVKEVNGTIREAQLHYVSLKRGYILFKKMLKTTTLDTITSTPNLQKIYKLFFDLSSICNVAETPQKMVYALLIYMFPNVFGHDNRFIYYRIQPISKIKFRIFSPFKLNLIRILVEEKFYNNESKFRKWKAIGTQVDKMLAAESAKYKINEMYRLRSIHRIKTDSEDDTIFIKHMAEKCSTSQELVEKVLKLLFADLFKTGDYKLYRHDDDVENGFIGLDKIKLDIVHEIVEPCMTGSRTLASAPCKEMINKYFENPLHIIGKNIQECIEIARS